jgi:hypothetical protein
LRDLQLSQALVTLRRFENGNELSGRVAMMIGCRLTRRGRDGRVFRTRCGGEWKMENWSGQDSLPTAEMVSSGRGLGDPCTSQWYLGIFQGHRGCSRYLSFRDIMLTMRLSDNILIILPVLSRTRSRFILEAFE